MRKLLVIKKHIGIDSTSISKEKYLLDNIESLTREELAFKKKFLDGLDITFDEKLPLTTEEKSIKIDNLVDGKNCEDIVLTEFAKEFIFNSNNIEGSKIPPERVREIIDTGNTTHKNRNEVKEVQNSILTSEYMRKSFKFNLISIKKLYHILTKNLVRDGNIPYPRGFKKEQNIVGNSQTTPPEKVVSELTSLLLWYRSKRYIIHPLILAFEFHRRFEAIHPFLDGNGRTGRLIMNKILMSNGYAPIIVYKDKKTSYFNALEKAGQGQTKKYYQFMFEQMNKSYDYILKIISKY